jgi:hypothetical protein
MIPAHRRRIIRGLTQELREAIESLDYFCNGTLLSRTKTCGRPNCRCAKDPSARHGPYYEWTRMKNGRLVHSSVSREQAALLERALANARQVQELLKRWHELSEADILDKSLIAVPDSADHDGRSSLDIDR